MKWIALTGPIGSGKTSLAKALEPEYMRINFTDYLKELACVALHPYRRVTVGNMHQEKATYRGFLQQFGDLIGFTDNPQFVHDSLTWWYELGRPACVFDNVRSVAQAETLAAMGFKIVRLWCPTDVCLLRAGGSFTREQAAHGIETPLPSACVDEVIDVMQPLDRVVAEVRAL